VKNLWAGSNYLAVPPHINSKSCQPLF
jgi:hypothetical protein